MRPRFREQPYLIVFNVPIARGHPYSKPGFPIPQGWLYNSRGYNVLYFLYIPIIYYLPTFPPNIPINVFPIFWINVFTYRTVFCHVVLLRRGNRLPRFPPAFQIETMDIFCIRYRNPIHVWPSGSSGPIRE